MTDSPIGFAEVADRLVPILQTLIVATFGYVAHLLRDIRKQVSGLRKDLEEIQLRYERHEVMSEQQGQRYRERIDEINRRLNLLERR